MKAVIEKHPLRDCYMLWMQGTAIPPFFGTMQECKKARFTLCKNINEKLLEHFKHNKPSQDLARGIIEFVNTSLDCINENQLIDLLEYWRYKVAYHINDNGCIVEYRLN